LISSLKDGVRSPSSPMPSETRKGFLELEVFRKLRAELPELHADPCDVGVFLWNATR